MDLCVVGLADCGFDIGMFIGWSMMSEVCLVERFCGRLLICRLGWFATI